MKCFACGTSDPTFEKVVGDAVEVKLSKFWLLRGVQIGPFECASRPESKTS